MATLYIIFSPNLNRYYTGTTKELLQSRIEKHNLNYYGSNHFTSRANDWKLFHSIKCENMLQALTIEKHIKRMKSRAYIENFKFKKISCKSINAPDSPPESFRGLRGRWPLVRPDDYPGSRIRTETTPLGVVSHFYIGEKPAPLERMRIAGSPAGSTLIVRELRQIIRDSLIYLHTIWIKTFVEKYRIDDLEIRLPV